MKSNFDLLGSEWADLHNTASKAEDCALTDARIHPHCHRTYMDLNRRNVQICMLIRWTRLENEGNIRLL